MAQRADNVEKTGTTLYLQERYAVYSAALQFSSDLDQKLASMLQLSGLTLAMHSLLLIIIPGAKHDIGWVLVGSLVLMAGMVGQACRAWWPSKAAVIGTSTWMKARQELVELPKSDVESIKKAISNATGATIALAEGNSTKATAVKTCIVLFGAQMGILILSFAWLLIWGG